MTVRRPQALLLAIGLWLGVQKPVWATSVAPETWYPDDAAASELMQVDRDFAVMSVREGVVAAFRRYSAADVVNLPASRPTTDTVDGLLARLATIGSDVMSWVVEHAEVTHSGESGYTYGTWQIHKARADGPTLSQGRYLTVWHRQADGQWRAVVDIANTDTRKVRLPTSSLSPSPLPTLGRLQLRLDPRSGMEEKDR